MSVNPFNELMVMFMIQPNVGFFFVEYSTSSTSITSIVLNFVTIRQPGERLLFAQIY
jgi:hypothetical protein